jgi:Flp pilus assembly pilin Flp
MTSGLPIHGRPPAGDPMTTFRRVRQLSRQTREGGQGLAEYALILALIAIIAIVALIFLGGQVSTIISSVGHSM